MPQLPPVAAAAFVLALLTAIVVTTAIVQTRARRRRMRLAAMVRATAPVPRPAVPLADVAPASQGPVRGQSYEAAREAARFEPFPERRRREPAAGRPARRLAAHIAHAPAAVSGASAVETPAVAAAQGCASHGGLADVASALLEPIVASAAVAVDAPVVVVETPPDVRESSGEAEPVAASTPAGRQMDSDSVSPARPSPEAPRVTVLAARPVAPALPALMAHEFALGDAARLLREALPPALTMTDGRQLRRAVAVGAATSVVAAAFVIRGRRR